MRIKLDLLNVSSQPLFSVGIGNLPETYGMKAIGKGRLPMDYPITSYGTPENRCQRNESISDNSRLPTTFVNWRLPKPERWKRLCIRY